MQNFGDPLQGEHFQMRVESKWGRKCIEKLAIFRKRWEIRPRLLTENGIHPVRLNGNHRSLMTLKVTGNQYDRLS